MAAYYNEHDKFTAAWLRELIEAGLIAAGEVDERDIQDVSADDVRGFAQCHFFAGIGGWSYALRLAGWPDDRPVWTGSCPCQPFSVAGKGRGTEDPRHLWPQFRRLIRQCRPPVVFGEQVASKAGRRWLSAVFADLEALAYRTAGADLCAAGVGAFHIRQRLWWVADTMLAGWAEGRPVAGRGSVAGGSGAGELAESDYDGRKGSALHLFAGRSQPAGADAAWDGEISELEHSNVSGARRDGRAVPSAQGTGEGERGEPGRVDNSAQLSGATSFWSGCEWIPCRDGKFRPIEPGTFPLAHGIPARVGRLRGYGNAIVPQVAAAFIEAYLEATRTHDQHPPPVHCAAGAGRGV